MASSLLENPNKLCCHHPHPPPTSSPPGGALRALGAPRFQAPLRVPDHVDERGVVQRPQPARPEKHRRIEEDTKNDCFSENPLRKK